MLILKKLINFFFSKQSLNLTYFNEAVLKLDTEQTITGDWKFKEVHIAGDFNVPMINNLNLVNDIVRHDAQWNNITAKKIIQNLSAKNLNCPYPCIVQGVDLVDWMSSSVSRDGDHTIQGHVIFEGPVTIHELYSDKPINNITFQKDMILSKTGEQVINGNIRIINKYGNSGQFVIESLDAGEINSKSVNEFFLNLVLRGDQDKTTIDSKLNFIKPLTVGHLKCDGKFYGTDLKSLTSEIDNTALLKQYETERDGYYKISERLYQTYQDYAFYLDHFDVRQVLVGQIGKIVSIRFPFRGGVKDSVAILTVERNTPVVQFYKWNVETGKIILDVDFQTIKFDDFGIIDIEKVQHHDKECLFIETFNLETKTFKQSLLTFNEQFNGFHLVYDFVSNTSRRVLSVTANSKDCMAIYSEYLKNIEIFCITSGSPTLELQQNIQITDSIKQAVTINQNQLVVLTNEGKVMIWESTPIGRFRLKQVIHLISPVWVSTIQYEHYNYIAVCSQHMNNSIYHGYVEIYRSSAIDTKDLYSNYQKIYLKIPVQAEFSILPTNELILYVLTNNPIQSLIVYNYAGVSGFSEFVVSSTIPKGKHFAIIKINEHKKEMIAITTIDDVLLIEAVMK